MSLHKGILGQQFGGATVQQDQTLEDYIHRKRRAAAFDTIALENQARSQEKKLSFEEWSQTATVEGVIEDMNWRVQRMVWELVEAAWKAGQENA